MRSIPFVDQLAGADPALIVEEYGAINDATAAETFGVRLQKEFSFWAWRACAIANVAMVLSAESKLDKTLYGLTIEALRMYGYAFKNRRGAQDVGWKHSALRALFEARGLKAKPIKFGIKDIGRLLNQGYVIASVKSDTGGHMVLIKEINDDSVVFNDPYTYKSKGGENVELPLDEFNKIFLGRGVTIWLN